MSAMTDVDTRMGSVWDSFRARRLERRLERSEEERSKLRMENSVLVGELAAEREERDRLLGLLDEPSEGGGGFRRLLFWAGLGYGAWTMYRNRRTQVRGWIAQARSRGMNVARAASGRVDVARQEARNLGREAREEVEEFTGEVRESTRRVMDADPTGTGTGTRSTGSTTTGTPGMTGTSTTWINRPGTTGTGSTGTTRSA